MFLTPAGSRRVDRKKKKKITQTRREDHFSCLIKQSVYDDSCQTDTNTLRQKCGNESSVKSLKWNFWRQRSGRTDEGVFSISGQGRTNNAVKNPPEVCFMVSCGYPTCLPSREACWRSGARDPSEVPVGCRGAIVSRLEVSD